jgi:hypothetical protein
VINCFIISYLLFHLNFISFHFIYFLFFTNSGGTIPPLPWRVPAPPAAGSGRWGRRKPHEPQRATVSPSERGERVCWSLKRCQAYGGAGYPATSPSVGSFGSFPPVDVPSSARSAAKDLETHGNLKSLRDLELTRVPPPPPPP